MLLQGNHISVIRGFADIAHTVISEARDYRGAGAEVHFLYPDAADRDFIGGGCIAEIQLQRQHTVFFRRQSVGNGFLAGGSSQIVLGAEVFFFFRIVVADLISQF